MHVLDRDLVKFDIRVVYFENHSQDSMQDTDLMIGLCWVLMRFFLYGHEWKADLMVLKFSVFSPNSNSLKLRAC